MTVYLEDVFKTSGIPTHTFVKPPEYNKLIVALRTKGRGLVVEGPSGIGKTTCIAKAIEELAEQQKAVLLLSARKVDDLQYIEALPELGQDLGIVIIDDFHRLTEKAKKSLADFMKVLADEEREDAKVILIGINKAGNTLVSFSEDLNNRIDTVKFELNPDDKITELISKGENALNVQIEAKKDIVTEARGSFHITQMLCKEACLYSDILDRSIDPSIVSVSLDVVKDVVLTELDRTFYTPAKNFSTGTKLRREGRAPYLNMLKWLSESEDWTVQMDNIMVKYPEIRGSISQVVEKGYLINLIDGNSNIQRVVHYDSKSKILSIEDPKFLFYIRNIHWNRFSKKIGFYGDRFSTRYDFALSFAGRDRAIAESIFECLTESEIQVFYDDNESHRILAENIEEYLGPIYESEAKFVIALISSEYPKRVWTNFESDKFKHRFGEKAVIPIWFSDTSPSQFDVTRKVGGISYDLNGSMADQCAKICEKLVNKLSESRRNENLE